MHDKQGLHMTLGKAAARIVALNREDAWSKPSNARAGKGRRSGHHLRAVRPHLEHHSRYRVKRAATGEASFH